MTSNEYDSMLPSISSKSEGTLLTRRMYKNPALHERCTMMDMLKLREVFHSAQMGRLLPTEFREVLRDLLNAEYDEEEFKLLFLKINSARNGEIDWDELVSHLLLGYFTSDADERSALPTPVAGLPRVLRSRHRHPVSRVLFCPDVGKVKL
ncbi:unnamed protein product [Plutella xylostella]|uniref:(diamondback moth) hypothetical protein n=1 Tax=Plutella xylostella TaxID=51655 RepID=A0A8S4EF43_PLUXY|nr:unnamed protein product [Plutella xylostella]